MTAPAPAGRDKEMTDYADYELLDAGEISLAEYMRRREANKAEGRWISGPAAARDRRNAEDARRENELRAFDRGAYGQP